MSLAILVVLALMAVVFATMAGVERSVSRNHVDAVRARFLADSGVHHAMAMLKAYLESGGTFVWNAADPPLRQKRDRAWIYSGEDINENGRLDAGDADIINGGVLDTVNVPLDAVPNPSYAVETSPSGASPAPRRMAVRGTANRVGISGALDGSYGRNADVYTVRVVDANALLYINDDNPNLPRMLDHVAIYRGVHPAGVRPGDARGWGWKIWTRRPWTDVRDLQSLLPPNVYDTLSPFLTADAFVDDKVANPVPLGPEEIARYRHPNGQDKYVRPVDSAGRPIYRYGHGRDYDGSPVDDPLRFCRNPASPSQRDRAAVYGWDELNPQHIEVAARAPVDINYASREVLMAVLEGLEGFFAMESPTNVPEYGYDFIHRMRYTPSSSDRCSVLNCLSTQDWGRWGTSRRHVDELATLFVTQRIGGPATGASGPAGGPDAAVIADEILRARPFLSWEAFHRFCDDLVVRGVIRDTRPNWIPPERAYASRAVADVLKANFNPNLHLNELNPNDSLLMLVDKTDLITSSTEGILRPGGVFRITSLGRVLQPDPAGADAFTAATNVVVAEAQVSATIRLFDLAHHTNQKDFFENARFAPAGGGVRTSYGTAVESGPEPHNGPAARLNEYEGFVQLAGMGGDGRRPPTDGSLWRTLTQNGAPCSFGSRMHAHYAYDFDLHGARTDPRCLTTVRPPGYLGRWHYNHPDPSEPGGPYTSPYCPNLDGRGNRYALARSFRVPRAGGTSPVIRRGRVAASDLRVDGAYSERHSALLYAPGNVNDWRSMQGTVAYWVKPSYDLTNMGKIRTGLDLGRIHGRSPIPMPPGQTVRTPGFDANRNFFNPTPFGQFFIPHQLYDIDSLGYSRATIAAAEGVPFDYVTALSTLVPGGAIPNWTPSQIRTIRDLVVNPHARQYLIDTYRETMLGFKPRSLAFGYAFLYPASGLHSDPWTVSGNPEPYIRQFRGQEVAINTYGLNHTGHLDERTSFLGARLDSGGRRIPNNMVDQGRWTHITVAWNMRPNRQTDDWDEFGNQRWFQENVRIFVNGRSDVMPRWRYRGRMIEDRAVWNPETGFWENGHWQDWRWTWQYFDNPSSVRRRLDWGRDEYGNPNPVRIGSPSVLHPNHIVYDSNYPADATIDELYAWDDAGGADAIARTLFNRGRYYRGPDPLYTSAPVDLTDRRESRRLAPPAAAGATGSPSPRDRVLYGLSWTAYTDDIWNHRDGRPANRPLPVGVQVEVSPDGGGRWIGPFTAEDYSWAGAATGGRPVVVTDPANFRYRFRFTGVSGGASVTLLETPILDDLWIVSGPEETEILRWVVE